MQYSHFLLQNLDTWCRAKNVHFRASLGKTYSLTWEFLFPAQAAKTVWYALYRPPKLLFGKYLTCN